MAISLCVMCGGIGTAAGQDCHILVFPPVAVAVEPGPFDPFSVLQIVGKVLAGFVGGKAVISLSWLPVAMIRPPLKVFTQRSMIPSSLRVEQAYWAKKAACLSSSPRRQLSVLERARTFWSHITNRASVASAPPWVLT